LASKNSDKHYKRTSYIVFYFLKHHVINTYEWGVDPRFLNL